ncbi:MAG TPA: LpqB family beta-propeller domain-containing protein, partial [Myxococcaceae bacterium]|nr:LpqB family beta-propeller domain-containing protein [Myxococcaceae bacterium]
TRAREELTRLARRPFTPLEPLTRSGYRYTGLTVSPDGRWLLASRQEPDEDDVILRFPLEGDTVGPPERLITRSTGYQASFSHSSRFLVFDQSHRTRYAVASDLYILDLKTDEIVRISPGFHARDADVHPDGRHLVFVSNEEGRNRLLLCNTAWEEVAELLGPQGRRRISAPRISPDGQSVVFMLHDDETGGEDLVLLGPEGARVLLADGAQNLAPTWTPDGEAVVFASDRDGVSNVYALEVASRRLYRLTHVQGGLFWPVVDPARQWVYAASYSSRGYDVVRFPWAPETWERVAELPDFPPLEGPRPEASAPVAASADRAYEGWRSLGPQYVLPSVLLRPGTFQVGALVGAVDPLYFQHYELAVRYDSASRLPVGRFFYFDGRAPWALDVELSHDAVPVGPGGELLRSFTGAAALTVPLGDEHSHTSLRPGLGVQVLSSALDSVLVGGRLEVVEDTEFKQLGYSFFESGSRLRLGARGLWDVEAGVPAVQVEAQARIHVPLGWKRHVLHLELEAAAFVSGRELSGAVLFAGGEASFPFSLGSPVSLNGYAPYALASPQLAVATAHYTFPLAELERGPGRLPLFLRRTSAGLRLQVAAVDSLRPERLPLAAGVELYQDLLVGDLFPLVARLGLYQGVPALGGSTQVVFSLAAND